MVDSVRERVIKSDAAVVIVVDVVNVFPEAIVVFPFKEITPVPVEKVPAPVWEKEPSMVIPPIPVISPVAVMSQSLESIAIVAELLPKVVAPVVVRVPKAPAPVVWMVPLPALRDIKVAAPAVVTDQLSSIIETPVEAALPRVIVSAPPLPIMMVSAPVEPKVMVAAELASREVPETTKLPPTVALPVVVKVPKEPAPVVWIVPEPAFKEVPVMPAKVAAPAEVTPYDVEPK